MTDTFLALLARTLLGVLHRLPLRAVGRLGRAAGAVFYILDARHRRVALRNLQAVFGSQLPERELRRIARENFRRIGENFCCAAKTAVLPPEAIRECCEMVGIEKILGTGPTVRPGSVVVAIGHFGNFELYARMGIWLRGKQGASTYRGLPHPSLDRLLRELRSRSGCLFFERRTEASALRRALREQAIVLGLLADQHAGDNGLRIPFLGRESSTSAAPALLALRYGCPLLTAICYRVGLGRWRIEVGDEIPTHLEGRPRELEHIMLEVNRVFETAIHNDPPNWFWVHKRWKPARRSGSRRRAAPSVS